MKNRYLILAVASTFVAATSFAQKPIVTEVQLQEFLKTHSLDAAATQKPTLVRQKKGEPKRKSVMKSAPFDLVTEQPAGELKTLVGNLGGYYSIFSYILPATDMGRAVDVVYGDDGYFYIKNPFSQFATNSWLKGSVNGDTISVEAQPIYYEAATSTYEENVCYACKMKYGYVEDYGQNFWAIDLDNPTLKMVVRNDSIIMQNDNGYSGLGLFYSDGEWTGFGEYRKILSPQTDVAVTLPESASAKDYVMTYGTYEDGTDTLTIKRQLVKLYNDGNDYYLSDLTGHDDQVYAKGTLADNKLTIKSGQYMGLSTADKYAAARYFNYFESMGWKRVPTYGNAYEDSTYFKNDFVFDYDAANDRFVGENSYLSVNGGNTKVNTLKGFKNPELTPFVEVKAAPAKPTIYGVEDCYETYGYSYIEAVLSNATAKGEFLDTHRIYYNLNFDDEEYVFYPDEYVNIDEEMTDVPYGFVDNEDFQTYKGRRVIDFYLTDFKKVALTEFYVDSDGVSHYSEPAIWDDGTSGVDKTISDKTVKTARYYDLGGRAVNKLQSGIYIKATTYSDGSVKMKKVVVNK